MPERPERFFCSLASRANNEALAGTVARIRSWLLIEYPSVWRRSAVDDSRLFSPAVKAHLRSIGVERTLLVRQIHRVELAGSGDVCRFLRGPALHANLRN